MNCQFRLDHYLLESVAVAPNERFDAELSAHTGDISASINIAPHTKDKGKYRLTLEILAKPSPGQEEAFFPYEVSIRGRGFFSFKNPQEDAEHVLRLNGAAILYGLLRGQIAQITAQSVHGQFLLPTFNFVDLQEQVREVKKSKESSRKPKKSARKSTKRAQK